MREIRSASIVDVSTSAFWGTLFNPDRWRLEHERHTECKGQCLTGIQRHVDSYGIQVVLVRQPQARLLQSNEFATIVAGMMGIRHNIPEGSSDTGGRWTATDEGLQSPVMEDLTMQGGEATKYAIQALIAKLLINLCRR